mmetsp:Transcript_62997/g.150052  ORF Transcript_62997/g.150052 Transcript_62997/m.150052 type:complete len:679 (-) Transcript_62997:78-2114(-)
MGPRGFWPELRRHGAASCIQGAEVERLLEGQTIAVDAAVWFYEAQRQDSLVKAYGPERAVLKTVFERCVRWLRKGILPLLVLEGAKGGRASRAFSIGNGQLGEAFMSQGKVKMLLQALGIPYVEAEGEAEATCAALVKRGVCSSAATTDADALLFGATTVYRGLDLIADGSSKCEVWDLAAIEKATGLDREGLIVAAWLAGCDYDVRCGNPARSGHGVQQFGMKKAFAAARALRREGHTPLSSLRDLLAGKLPVAQLPKAQDPLKRARKRRSVCPPKTTGSNHGEDANSLGADGFVVDAAAARLLRKLHGLGQAEPNTAEGFEATVKQYQRGASSIQDLGASRVKAEWRGIDEAAAEAAIQRIFAASTDPKEKLLPLHMEWILRRLAADRPSLGARTLCDSQLRKWAKDAGFSIVPSHAASKVTDKQQEYALIKWIATREVDGPVKIAASIRHARLGLAKACGLLPALAPKGKQRQIRDFFSQSSSASQVTTNTQPSQPAATQPSTQDLAGEEHESEPSWPSTPLRARSAPKLLATPQKKPRLSGSSAASPEKACSPLLAEEAATLEAKSAATRAPLVSGSSQIPPSLAPDGPQLSQRTPRKRWASLHVAGGSSGSSEPKKLGQWAKPLQQQTPKPEGHSSDLESDDEMPLSQLFVQGVASSTSGRVAPAKRKFLHLE